MKFDLILTPYNFVQNQIGDTTIKIIDHEIKRYVQRVKDFKTKTEQTKALGSTVDPGFEQAQEDLRKEEKKLAVSFKSLCLFVFQH